MVDEAKLQGLLVEILASGQTPEDVCRNCPDLLPEVRRRLLTAQTLNEPVADPFSTWLLEEMPNPSWTVAGDKGAEATPKLYTPGYELLDVLGWGGMGVVFKARQLNLNRLVALKVIRTGPTARSADRQRFHYEAEAISRLLHANIVEVYEVGEWQAANGSPVAFLAMEFCAGGSLAQRLKGTPMQPGEAAQLVETVAAAIQVAHAQRIIHRDLKPGNILFVKKSGRQESEGTSKKTPGDKASLSPDSCHLAADSFPKIADFGLAKNLDQTEGQTQSGDVVGTPSYMAPEQAAGRLQAIGPHTDVYALGAILYELLTGRPPFKAATRVDTIVQVLQEDPVPPRRLQAKVPVDLETICLKCLQKDPAKRYLTAESLAEDLHRYRMGAPIKARPTSAWERGRKWARREPAAAGLLLLTILLLAFLSVSTMFLFAAHESERQAKVAAIQAAQYAEDKQREAALAQELAEAKEQEARRDREDARLKGQTAHEVAQFLVGLFNAADPSGLEGLGFRQGSHDGADLTARALLDLGTKKVQTDLADQPIVKAAMLDSLGNVYRSLGLFDKAGPLLEEGLSLRRKHFGDDHEDTAESLHHLGWFYHDLGKYPEGEKLYRQALAIRDRRLGKDNLKSASTMFNLAWLISHHFDQPLRERLDEAEVLFRRVLEIRRQKLGPRHREVGLSLAALSALHLTMNREEAMALAYEALEILERAENKDVLGSGFLKYLFAVQLRQIGRFTEAEELYHSVLAQATSLLGDEHPLVALLLGDLAGLLRKKGDMDGAREAIGRALGIGRRSPLRSHPSMIEALIVVGDDALERGNIKEAETHFREALEYTSQGSCPQLSERSRNRLIELLRSQHRDAEADALAKQP